MEFQNNSNDNNTVGMLGLWFAVPCDNTSQEKIPTLATNMITCRLATLEPMEELRKFTASLLTPTTRSNTANAKRSMMKNKYVSAMGVNHAIALEYEIEKREISRRYQIVNK